MQFTESYKTDLLQTIEAIDLSKVDQAIEWLRATRDAGRQIFMCGNGGSASTASHFVCDMLKGASYQRSSRFRIISLTDNMPTLTAYSNDVGYDIVFLEQLKNFAREGDRARALLARGAAAGPRPAPAPRP